MLVGLGHANAGAATLDWHAPTSCPDAASLRARVESRLERSLDDIELRVEISVSHSRGRYTAKVDLGAVTVANDVRTLTSRRCGELADAVAVIIARVANEAATATGVRHAAVHVAASEPALEPDDAPRSVDRVAPIVTPGGERRPMRAWTIGARVSALSGIGVLPQVGLGGELAVTVRAGRHLAELGAARWVTSAAQLHDGAPAKIHVNLDVTVARYGWRPPGLPLRAWLAVEVGSMHGDGVDLPNPQISDGRWIAAGSGFGVAWQMKPWIRLFGGTEIMVAVERVRFTGGDGMVVYAPSPMSVRTTCGLEVGWQ